MKYKSLRFILKNFIFVLALAVFTVAFYACDPNYDSMSISLSCANNQVNIELTEKSNSAEIVVSVSADNGISKIISASSEDSRIFVSTCFNDDQTTTITIRALNVCSNVPVYVKTAEGNKTEVFYVNVTVPLTSISANTDKSVLYAIKGETRVLDANEFIIFNPVETTHKDISYSFASENIIGASISGNNLYIDDSYLGSTIEIVASSVWNPSIKTNFTLEVLEKLDSKVSFECYYGADSSDTVDHTKTIKLAKNIKPKSSVELTVFVDTERKINISSKLSVPNIIGKSDYKIIPTDEGTKYSFTVSADKLSGVVDLSFVISYQGYSYQYKTTNPIHFEVYDIVDSLQVLVNGKDDSSSNTHNLTAYDTYVGTFGLCLEVNAFPTTVARDGKKLCLTFGKNCTSENYVFFDETGKEIVGDDDNNYYFYAGSQIFIKAKNGSVEGAKFTIHPIENNASDLIQTFNLTAEQSPDATSFELVNASIISNQNYYYLTNSYVSEQVVKFKLEHGNVSNINVISSNSSILEIDQTINASTTEINVYYFSIKSIKNSETGTATLTIKYENGLYIYAIVEVFEELNENNVSFSVLSEKASASVGKMQKLDDTTILDKTYHTQFTVAIKNKNSISLNINASGSTAVAYSFFDKILESDMTAYDTDYENFNNFVETGMYEATTSIINSISLNSFKQLSAINVGKTWVKAEVSGYKLNADGEKIFQSFDYYFMVEVYNPISTLSFEYSTIKLYSQKSLTDDDYAYSTKDVAVKMNSNATYYNIEWSGDNNVDAVTGLKKYTIFAKDEDIFAYENTGLSVKVIAYSTLCQNPQTSEYEYANQVEYTIMAKVTEFNVVQYISLKIIIVKAQEVEKINVTNFNTSNGIYLELLQNDDDIKFYIEAEASTLIPGVDPFNKNLVYTFIPDLTTSVSVINLAQNGVITIPAHQTIGGSGQIRIAPKDKFVGGVYVPGENDIAIYIDIVVADGRTRESSFRVDNISKIVNSNAHYTLVGSDSDFVIKSASDYALFNKFNGAIYGCITGDDKIITIQTNKTLFDTITENAVLADLIIVGVDIEKTGDITTINAMNVSTRGVVADQNYGKIQNVKIEAYSGTKYVPTQFKTSESVNVGGFVGENFGLIENCLFTGVIEATNAYQIGGIAGLNNGTISYCDVEFYNYQDTFGHIKGGTYIGGIAGCMSDEYAIISNCSVVSYAYDFDGDNYTNKVVFINASTSDEICPNIILGQTTNNSFNIDRIEDLLDKIKSPKSSLSTNNKIISKDDKSVVFFYSTDAILSSQENYLFEELNIILFNELLGEEANFIAGISNNESVLKVSPNSIEICGIGSATLTLFSKFDFSSSVSYTIYSIYPISNFELKHDNVSFGNNSVGNIKISSGTFDVLGSVDSSVMLVSNYILFKTNNLSLNFDSEYISGSGLGTYIIDVLSYFNDTANDVMTVDYKLVYNNADTTIQTAVNDILQTVYDYKFFLNLYKGADLIELSTTTAEIEPNDEFVIYAYEYSDLDYDDLNEGIEVKSQNGDIFDITKELVETTYYTDYNAQTKTDIKAEAVYYKHKIKITIDVKDAYKNSVYKNDLFKFTVSSLSSLNNFENISANIILDEFELYINSQTIESLDIKHYTLKNQSIKKVDGVYKNVYSYSDELSSVLTPGESGLLQIDIYPVYADFDYITVDYTTNTSENYKLNLGALEKIEGDNQFVKLNSGLEVTDTGIKIKNTFGGPTYTSKLSSLYLSTYVSENINKQLVFFIKVKAFNSEGQQVSYEMNFNLVVQYLTSAEISSYNESGEVSNVAVKGTYGKIAVEMKQEQQWDEKLIVGNISQDVEDINNSIHYNLLSKTENNNKGTVIYEFNVFYGTKLTPANGSGYITISVQVSWIVNGKVQTKQSSISLGVVDFALENKNISLKTDKENKTNLNAYIGINTPLEFDFTVSNPNLDGDKNNAFEYFLKNFYYQSPTGEIDASKTGYYIVNKGHSTAGSFLENIEYVNGNSSTSIVGTNGQVNSNALNGYLKISADFNGNISVIGLKSGVLNFRLSIPIQYPNSDSVYEVYFDFTITILVYSNEDLPLIIDNEQAFVNALKSTDKQDYILMSDLYLTDYTALSTNAISSLDGNGYVINILNYAKSDSSSVNYALFDQVSENTTLKNLVVNLYYVSKIEIDVSKQKLITIAGLANTNNGIIYNCYVVAYRSDASKANISVDEGINVFYSVDKISEEINSSIAGFVITNNGSISNSRVGGASVQTINEGEIDLDLFTISGQGNIAGFVCDNYGYIASSFFDNGQIINNTASGIKTYTSGFAGSNSGSINLSYARGVGEYEYSYSTAGITTASISSGFVYSNSGDIGDCFANIMLGTNNINTQTLYASGRLTSGFVYTNSGNIERCLTSSKIEDAKTTQMNFIGVGDLGDLNNTGYVDNSYYFNPNFALDDLYTSVSADINVKRLTEPDDESLYYGFAFADTSTSGNGVWYSTNYGLELVSASTISFSNRYIANEKRDSVSGELVEYDLPYSNDYKYGSASNPIIIRNAQEFNTVFGGDDANAGSNVSSYYDLQNKTVFGNYRLVSNITTDLKLTSTQMTLKSAKIDGNAFKIDEITLLADSNSICKNFGLFAGLENNSIILNLKLGVNGVSAVTAQSVGSVAGFAQDSKLVNISVSASSKTATIIGNNIVGGVVGKVIGDSEIKNINVKDICVFVNTSTTLSSQRYNRNETSNSNLNNNLSYGGGIAGVIDTYFANQKSNLIHSVELANPKVSFVKVEGATNISASSVGGITGYLGPNTSIQEASYIADVSTDNKLISYNLYAGGIVGECYGNLDKVVTEHEQEIQSQIENNVGNYYRNLSGTFERGNLTLFEHNENNKYAPKAIGGLVGLLVTGNISHSYSKINVCNENATFAGGLVGKVGYADNLDYNEIELYEVYAFGDVYAKETENASCAGGIAGYIDFNRSLTFTKVNAVNYYSLQYNNDTQKYYLPENIYDIYGMTGSEKIGNISSAELVYETTANLPMIKANPGSDEMFAITNVENSSTSVIPQTKSSYGNIAGVNTKLIDEELQSVSYFEYIDNKTSASEMDAYFKNAGWDSNYWYRYPSDMLPSLVSYLDQSLFYIRVQEDLLNVIKYPNATFIVIGNEINNGMVVVNDDLITNYSWTGINNFTGTLKGFNYEKQYGFVFENSQPFTMFKTVGTGAKISNLYFEGNENVDVTLIDQVVQANLNELTFTNYIIHRDVDGTDEINVGLLANKAYGVTVNEIKFIDSALNVSFEDDVVETLNAGILFGKVFDNGSATTKISDVSVYSELGNNNTLIGNSNRIEIETTDKTIENANIGGLIGLNESTIYMNYSVSSVDKDGNGSDIGTYAYNVLNSSTYNGLIITFTGNGEIETLNSGLVFGNTGLASFVTQRSLCGFDIVGAIITQNTNISDTANLGGFAGTNTSGLTVEAKGNKILIDCDIEISSAPNVNAGMLIGNASTISKVKNIETYGNIIVVNKDSVDDYVNNLGGVLGTTSNSVSIQNTTSDTNITLSSSETNNNIGGFVGYFASSEKLKIGSYKEGATVLDDDFKTKYSGEIVVNANEAKIGGFVGNLNSCNFEINKVVFDGIITAKQDDSASLLTTQTLLIGGIVGSTENTSLSTIESNYSVGDIYVQNCKGKTYAIGGIIGKGSSSTSVNSNYSLCTIYPANDFVKNENNINAIIGDTNGSSTTSVGGHTNTNYYVHQLCLCLQTDSSVEANNIYYSNDELSTCMSDIIKSDIGTFESPLGSKLNPNIINDLSDIGTKTGKYYVINNVNIETELKEDITFDTTKASLNLNNVFVVGDGYSVVNTSSDAVFDTISKTSVVTGLQVKANITSNKTGTIGAFANTNNGFIYSSNVVENYVEEEGKTISTDGKYGFVASNANKASAFVGTNSKDAFIIDCFTEVDVKAENGVSCGFVANNSGVISSSYSTGVLNSNSSSIAFAGGNGEIYRSYTASKIEKLNASDKIFGSNAIETGTDYSCFYDLYATGIYEASGVSDTNTMAIANDGDILTNYLIDDAKFGFEFGKNYGYLTFSGSAYGNLSYMTGTNTGTGSETNPQLIPTVGKLQQINKQLVSTTDADYKNYKLLYDIELTQPMIDNGGEDYGVKKWKAIGNDTTQFSGNFDGNNKTINNIINDVHVSSFSASIFGVISSANIENLNVEQNRDVLLNSAYVAGVVGKSIGTYENNSLLKNVNIVSDDGFEMKSSSTSSDAYLGAFVAYADSYSKIENCGINTSIKLAGSSNSTNNIIGGYVGGLNGGIITYNDESEDYQYTINNDINLEGKGKGNKLGGFVGEMNSSALIENIITGADVINISNASGTGELNAGGIAGKINSINSTLKNISLVGLSINNKSSNSSSYIGGIAGQSLQKNDATNKYIENVSLSGTGDTLIKLSASSGTTNYIGGLFGTLNSSTNIDLSEITTTSANFEISATSSNTQTNYLGGVAGLTEGIKFEGSSSEHLSFGSNITLKFDDKTNITNYVGGVVGKIVNGSIKYVDVNSIQFANSSAYTGNASSCVGGAFGLVANNEYYSTTDFASNVNISYNDSSSDFSLLKGSFGGFAGKISGSQKINLTDISTEIDNMQTSSGNVGGVVGSLNNQVKFSNISVDCDFESTNSSLQSNIGGIIGLNSSTNTEITSIKKVDGSITNAYNAGGFIGSNAGNNTTISDIGTSTNKLAIMSMETVSNSCGGLIGNNTGTNLAVDSINLKVEKLSGQNAGGFIGQSTTSVEIEDSICDFSLKESMSGITTFGGLLGNALNDCEITDCSVEFNGAGKEINVSYFGGFVGTSSEELTIENGNISLNNITLDGKKELGGVVSSCKTLNITSGLTITADSNSTLKSSDLDASAIITSATTATVSGGITIQNIAVETQQTSLDGSGFLIGNASSLTIDSLSISNSSYTIDSGLGIIGGLFGKVSGGTISGGTVGLDVNISNFACSTFGGIIGELNNATLFGFSSVSTTGTDSILTVGGIVGEANNSTISGCTNTSNISVGTSANSVGTYYAGGIAGKANNSDFYNCSNSGAITAGWQASTADYVITTEEIVTKLGGEYKVGGHWFDDYSGSDRYDKKSQINSQTLIDGSEKAYAGGIVGFAESDNNSYNSCSNTGNINAKAKVKLESLNIYKSELDSAPNYDFIFGDIKISSNAYAYEYDAFRYVGINPGDKTLGGGILTFNFFGTDNGGLNLDDHAIETLSVITASQISSGNSKFAADQAEDNGIELYCENLYGQNQLYSDQSKNTFVSLINSNVGNLINNSCYNMLTIPVTSLIQIT